MTKRKGAPALQLHTAPALTPPPDRGRLLGPGEVRDAFFPKKTTRWVRRTVAPEHKIYLNRTNVCWWEYDVRDWLDAQRASRIGLAS